MKKLAIILILSFALLLSFATLASAELLFSASAETGSPDFSLNYKGSHIAEYNGYGVDTSVSKSPSMLTLNADLNLFLIHVGAEYGTSNIGNGSTFSTATIKAGWDIGLPILSFQLFGGYQAFTLTKGDSISQPGLGSSAYWDLFAGAGVQASLGPLSVYGTTNIPIYGHFKDGINSDDSPSLSYVKVGVSYAPIPFVSLFVNYRDITAESKVMKLESDGYTAGVQVSF